jgi:aarF domain-containing kinase
MKSNFSLGKLLMIGMFLSIKVHVDSNSFQTLRRGIRTPLSRHLRVTMAASSIGIRDISSQIKDARQAISNDANAAMVIEALRGRNLNDDDRQRVGIDMKIVEMTASQDASDCLPTVYDPVKLESYFSRRPSAVVTRVWQIISTSSTFLLTVLFDLLSGRSDDIEVKRAAELRNTIVSLGPFFIKLGQALSIRPDILSPRAMVELQQLCDKVPCYDDGLAMKTIENELGRPPDQIFSKMSPDPVAGELTLNSSLHVQW